MPRISNKLTLLLACVLVASCSGETSNNPSREATVSITPQADTNADEAVSATLTEEEDVYPNLLPFGDFANGVPETRSGQLELVSTTNTPLDAAGFSQALRGTDTPSSNYFRYKHGSDLAGKRVVAFFTAYVEPGHDVITGARAFLEDPDMQNRLSVPDSSKVSVIDSGDLKVFRYDIAHNQAGNENLLFGIQQKIGHVYLTNAYLTVVEDFDVDIEDVYTVYIDRK